MSDDKTTGSTATASDTNTHGKLEGQMEITDCQTVNSEFFLS